MNSTYGAIGWRIERKITATLDGFSCWDAKTLSVSGGVSTPRFGE